MAILVMRVVAAASLTLVVLLALLLAVCLVVLLDALVAARSSLLWRVSDRGLNKQRPGRERRPTP